jgi:hypothetical protein
LLHSSCVSTRFSLSTTTTCFCFVFPATSIIDDDDYHLRLLHEKKNRSSVLLIYFPWWDLSHSLSLFRLCEPQIFTVPHNSALLVLGPTANLNDSGSSRQTDFRREAFLLSRTVFELGSFRYLPTYVASLRRQSDATDFVKRIDFLGDTHKRSPISGGREDEKMEYPLRS